MGSREARTGQQRALNYMQVVPSPHFGGAQTTNGSTVLSDLTYTYTPYGEPHRE